MISIFFPHSLHFEHVKALLKNEAIEMFFNIPSLRIRLFILFFLQPPIGYLVNDPVSDVASQSLSRVFKLQNQILILELTNKSLTLYTVHYYYKTYFVSTGFLLPHHIFSIK